MRLEHNNRDLPSNANKLLKFNSFHKPALPCWEVEGEGFEATKMFNCRRRRNSRVSWNLSNCCSFLTLHRPRWMPKKFSKTPKSDSINWLACLPFKLPIHVCWLQRWHLRLVLNVWNLHFLSGFSCTLLCCANWQHRRRLASPCDGLLFSSSRNTPRASHFASKHSPSDSLSVSLSRKPWRHKPFPSLHTASSLSQPAVSETMKVKKVSRREFVERAWRETRGVSRNNHWDKKKIKVFHGVSERFLINHKRKKEKLKKELKKQTLRCKRFLFVSWLISFGDKKKQRSEKSNKKTRKKFRKSFFCFCFSVVEKKVVSENICWCKWSKKRIISSVIWEGNSIARWISLSVELRRLRREPNVNIHNFILLLLRPDASH